MKQKNENNNGFYLFLSLDLVNSTLYKTKDPDWSELFIKIYNDTIDIVTQSIPKISLWKTLGDELLFYIRIKDKQELIDTFNKFYLIAQKANKYLVKSTPSNISTKLAYKTTLWSGMVSSTLGTDKTKWKYLNLVLPGLVSKDTLDFIGPDVDTGFRISKAAFRNILVVDAKLSAILNKVMPQFNQKARIVYFEQFKGVWDNRHYPVVWYYDDWVKLPSTFNYEDKFNSKIVMWIESENISKFRNVNDLDRIFKELNKESEISAITKQLKITK
ncbi:MAG: hypothetical protein Ta2E_04210 [Mycoplasmoidaceae bacterium]|nr:MAG: hypothetical protein Ta2E_04210 [Mycoplasmoidaceae bacterium]